MSDPSHSDQKAPFEEPEAALPASASLVSTLTASTPCTPHGEGSRRPLKVRSPCPARHAHPPRALPAPVLHKLSPSAFTLREAGSLLGTWSKVGPYFPAAPQDFTVRSWAGDPQVFTEAHCHCLSAGVCSA